MIILFTNNAEDKVTFDQSRVAKKCRPSWEQNFDFKTFLTISKVRLGKSTDI